MSQQLCHRDLGAAYLAARCVLWISVACVAGPLMLAAEPDAKPGAKTASAGMLQPMNGIPVAGSLRPTDASRGLRWLAADSTEPDDFDLKAVNFVRFPEPADAPKPAGDYCFELAGGDVLFGGLVELDENRAVLDVTRLGKRTVRLSHIRHIHRQGKGTGLVYVGPKGLADWQTGPPGKEWQEVRGLVFSEQGGGWLLGDVGLPPRASMELELSWKTKPEFGLALGVDAKGGDADKAFRIESWDNNLVLLREVGNEADVTPVEKIGAVPGGVRLSIYLDQTAGRCLVYSDFGELRADMKLNATKVPAFCGLRLVNTRGDLRLERLKIAHWNGVPPDMVAPNKPHLQLKEGSTLLGRLVRYDASAGEFVVRTETGESHIAAGSVVRVSLGAPAEVEPREVAAIYQDGTRVSGEFVRVEEGALWLKSGTIGEEIRLPFAGLRSLIVLKH